VLRGDDHLTNSAYQVWMLQSLGYTPPVCLHHGLLLGEDGAKLSKRTGSHSVADLREAGLFAAALQQAMVRLGHPNIPEEAHSLEALIEHCDIMHLSTSSVRWSNDDMWRWHTKLLHETPLADLMPLVQATIARHGINLNDERALAFADIVAGNLSKVEDCLEYLPLLTIEESLPTADASKEAGVAFFEAALTTWTNRVDTDWKAWTTEIKDNTGAKGKGLFMPLRLALTGQEHGPEMSKVIEFMGKEGVSLRLQQAIIALS